MNTGKSKKIYALRAGLVVVALGLWFWTQALISQQGFPAHGIGDRVHTLTAPLHDYLLDHTAAANVLLILSSALIDSLGIFLLARSIFGPTIRPFLGLLILFVLRQTCQAFCALPPPENMIWRNPGFPSLLVTYGVANDLFFSGHTGIAVLGAVELARTGQRWLAVIGIVIALFEASTVLILRAHYTMDVFTGAVAALWVAGIAAQLAPACDRLITRLSSGEL